MLAGSAVQREGGGLARSPTTVKLGEEALLPSRKSHLALFAEKCGAAAELHAGDRAAAVLAAITGTMAFDPASVPHSIDPKAGLRDYYDFASYNQSTQGHLNSDGLCFVKRNYDSPP